MVLGQWTKESILSLLDTNVVAVMRAIVAVYNLQTEDEKIEKVSKHENNVGFGKIDAKILAEYALDIKSGKGLTKAQIAIGRNKIKKYWRQLLMIANKENQGANVA